ncbi:MAG: asparaginase domain-containing protein [Bacteroidota bacterium]
MQLLFLQTGGTIDKDYPHTTNGWAFEFGEPAVLRILEKLQPSFEYECLTAFQKDSLEITDADRQRLVELIRQHSARRIIITHGTDTLIDTARYLAERIPDKCVVLTGAMRPERFSNSEAPINIGCAIAAAQLQESGIFIAMHGIVKAADKMQRDLETGKFY